MMRAIIPLNAPADTLETMNPALILHISAGGVGLITGSVTLAARKGEPIHRAWGKAFCLAMLVMSGMAAFLSVTVPGQMGNLPGSILTFYLVMTAWATVARPPMTVGRWDRFALIVPTAAAAVMAFFTYEAVTNPASQPMNAPPLIAYYIVTAVAALIAACDLKVVLQGGIRGARRVTRHLWRMSLGFFVATGSFFLGKQAHFPAFIRGSPVLLLLAFAPLLIMLFWLGYVLFTRRFNETDALPA